MHFSTLEIDANSNKALVAVQVDVERFGGDQAVELATSLLSPDSAAGTTVVAERTLTLQESGSQLSAKVYMEIENPQLWWTHELGEPALYTLRATVYHDGEQLEQQQREVGIRTLELDQSPDTDEAGTRFFRFVLNGVPIFVRGANWIPAHSFVGEISAERYEMLLSAAQEANMNMLRVWSGGIYEHEVFYELCNRLGILVWQDFMFACAMYPMDHHNKDNPKNKGDNLMAGVTGLPHNLEEYIDYSMIAQAEGLKFGIEHYRRCKPPCSGTLIWQLNDCWPVLSWSIVDSYGFGKAGYFYTKRAYAPVLASFQQRNDGGVELWITNDTLNEVTDTLTIRSGTFANGTVWEESCQIRVVANSSQVVWHCNAGKITAGPDSYLSVHSTKGLLPTNRYFFSPIKELQRTLAQPEIAITPHGKHELHVHLRAVTYTYFLHLLVPDERTHFTDNYFDLEAGESRTITVTNRSITLTPEMISVSWR